MAGVNIDDDEEDVGDSAHGENFEVKKVCIVPWPSFAPA